MDFINGGLAGAGATIFTNPIDVVKTRLQLQGELRARNEHTVRYRGIFHTLYVIARTDGLFALQKGLAPAMLLGFTMNSVRLGMFHIAEDRGWTKNKNGNVSIQKAIFWSSACGVLSGLTGNPASVIKTRIQAAAHPSIAVGRQHKYKGMLDGCVQIYKTEGFKGFYAGINGTCLRLAIGSGAQLTSFTTIKEYLKSHGYFIYSPVTLSFVASLGSGIVCIILETPFDVMNTRLYNQGSGSNGKLLYTGVLDCFAKIYRTEGLHGLYKGLGPLYLRIAPHTTLSKATIMDFLTGGLAGAAATILTNPMDVVKIRMQLQGEMRARTEYTAHYRGFMHAFYVIAQHDGLMALQKGLVPAMVLGFTMNAVRLGMYNVAENQGWTTNQNGKILTHKAVFWSSVSGIIGGIVGNPASVIKTRMQVATSQAAGTLGKQHGYTGTWDACKKIYRSEGIKGFFAGVNGTCVRLCVGSGAQLSSFSEAKQFLKARGICDHSPIGLATLASAISGVVLSLVVCPLDVMVVRLYNQSTKKNGDRLYNGVVDCLYKTFMTEGLRGLYKGLVPLYFRLAPHTTVSLVIWDALNLYFIPNKQKV